MKRLLILFFIIGTIINAQDYGDPSFYDSLETLNNTTTFQVRHNDVTSVISWWRLQTLLGSGSSLLSQQNNWTANQTYVGAGLYFGSGGYMQFANAKVGTYSRQPYFDATDSTFYITDANGNEIAFKSQAYNDGIYATSSGATDLPATYMTLATSQTVTGAKDINSLYDFRGGTVYLPYKTSYTASAKNQQIFVYSDGSVRGTLKDESNNAVDVIFATQAWANANFPSIGNFAVSTGTQNINPDWTFTSGSITLNDGYKINYGTGADLQLWHDGTNSQIRNNTGDLYIRSFSATDQIFLGTNSNDRWKISADGDFLPIVDGIVDIGNATYRVGNIHSDALYYGATNVATEMATKASQSDVSDSLLNRKLDPIVFQTLNPNTGEYIGPFRVSKDIEITSGYYYLKGTGSTITFNVQWGTTGNLSSPSSQLYLADATKSTSNGALISDETYDVYLDEGYWVWCEIVNVTGTVDIFSLTLNKSGR